MTNSGGPWGGGGNDDGRGSNGERPTGGRRGPNKDGPFRGLGSKPGPGRRSDDIPDIDELMNRGRDQLRVLMGGRGGPGSPTGGAGGDRNYGSIAILALLVGAVAWVFASIYTVKPEERSVELLLGEYSATGQPGLNFAPWPFVYKEIVLVSEERRIDIGTSQTGSEAGLMLTGDENIVDIDFQVVWNITDPAQYLFTLDDPELTIRAVAESAMREIIAQSELAPILNTNRGDISTRLKLMIQDTLDSYESGVNIIRVNFNKAEAPDIVVDVRGLDGSVVRKSPFDAFREVQNAEQERTRLKNVAEAYANKVTAQGRGNAAEILEQATGYSARVVNESEGEAERFTALLEEYRQAPEITRQRIWLEALERIYSNSNIVLMENGENGNGVLPYLPLNELRANTNQQGSN